MMKYKAKNSLFDNKKEVRNTHLFFIEIEKCILKVTF